MTCPGQAALTWPVQEHTMHMLQHAKTTHSCRSALQRLRYLANHQVVLTPWNAVRVKCKITIFISHNFATARYRSEERAQ